MLGRAVNAWDGRNGQEKNDKRYSDSDESKFLDASRVSYRSGL